MSKKPEYRPFTHPLDGFDDKERAYVLDPAVAAYFRATQFLLSTEEAEQYTHFVPSFTHMAVGLTGIRTKREQTVLNNRHLTDALTYSLSQFSEKTANKLYLQLMTDEETFVPGFFDIVEKQTDHGFNHIRRVEKWFKEFLWTDRGLRRDAHFLYYLPAAFIAIRLHDLFEIATSEKEAHGEGAAILALGYMLENYQLVAELGIPEADWEKIAWATAYICIHHSNPERTMEETSQTSGLFNPQSLLAVVEKPGRSFEQVFPAANLFSRTLSAIREGKLNNPPSFNQEEIAGLRKIVRLVAAADKFDSNIPADLSAIRTFLAMPDRAFYRSIGEIVSGNDLIREKLGTDFLVGYRQEDKKKKTVNSWVQLTNNEEETIRVFLLAIEAGFVAEAEKILTSELEMKIRFFLGDMDEAPDDFSRFCFESLRLESFAGTTLAVKSIYAKALGLKYQYINQAVAVFVKGEVDEKGKQIFGFDKAYDDLERNIIIGLLMDTNLGKEAAVALADLKNIEVVKDRIKAAGRDPKTIDTNLERVAAEKEKALGILQRKFTVFSRNRDLPNAGKKMAEVLANINRVQGQFIKTRLKPGEIEVPYMPYWPLSV